MQRVQVLLEKLNELANKKGETSLIEIDLMMDYTRVIYADLAETRSRLVFNGALPAGNQPAATTPTPPKEEKQEPVVAAPKQEQPEAPKEEALVAVPEVTASYAPEQIAEPVIITTPTEEEILKEEEEEAIAAPAPEPAPAVAAKPSLQSKIGINDTYLFMSELFENDKETYENALEELSNFDSYDAAITWLHDNALWDDKHEVTAESFKTILQAYYTTR